MRHVLLRPNGLRTDLDIDKALHTGCLWVSLPRTRVTRHGRAGRCVGRYRLLEPLAELDGHPHRARAARIAAVTRIARVRYRTTELGPLGAVRISG